MSFLASDALRGRGSATHDEFVAATYVVSQFQSFGLEAAQLQRVPLTFRRRHLQRHRPASRLRSRARPQTILLSSHLDHLGARRPPPARSSITEPMTMPAAPPPSSSSPAPSARFPPRPRRTIVFVCFGSEETGGQGDQYFLDAPARCRSPSIVANLEFEMIGQPDRAIRSGQLWLTGWERTNLGPTLATHGAPLVADPHPAEHFFQRSDNFALARRGIVAQTVSSYGLGAHYHQPTDDLAHIDFDHLAHAIESMISAVQWLANTDWKPSWNPGGRP